MAKIANVQEVSLELLRPYERNAKKHGRNQVEKLRDSITEFGFLTPCLIDSDYNLIAGHGRVMAAKELGIETVPCVFIEGLTEEQRRAYILADNRLGELGEWDMDTVQTELEALASVDFDVSVTGFDLEIETEDFDEERYTKTVNIPQYEPSGDPVSLGDLFDDKTFRDIVGGIEQSNVSDEEKEFLRIAATRHIVFSYKKIADYYASASAEMQKLMERSALVIIDVDDAIEYGYARIQGFLDEMEERYNA